MRRSWHALAILVAFPAALAAQKPGVPVRGAAVDSAGSPIENVEIAATTVGRLVRSRADGRFELDSLIAGPNRLLMRRLGWKAIDTVIMVGTKIPVELRITMARTTQSLEAIHIVSQDECPTKTLEGFDCRRRAGIGAFRDSAELAAIHPRCVSDMAAGMEGTRVRALGDSPCMTLESTVGWRCIRTLIDGRPNPAIGPIRMSDYVGVEFYDDEDKVPEWYKQSAYVGARAGTRTVARRGLPTVYGSAGMPGHGCALLVLWTHFAERYNPSLDQSSRTTRAMQSRRDSLLFDTMDSLSKKKP